MGKRLPYWLTSLTRLMGILEHLFVAHSTNHFLSFFLAPHRVTYQSNLCCKRDRFSDFSWLWKVKVPFKFVGCILENNIFLHNGLSIYSANKLDRISKYNIRTKPMSNITGYANLNICRMTQILTYLCTGFQANFQNVLLTFTLRNIFSSAHISAIISTLFL